MGYQANKWSWKHLAARLLLVPVVAGAAAQSASAQSYTPKWSSPGTTAPASAVPTAPSMPSPATPAGVAAKPADPHELLKLGRKALSESKLDVAQEFCLKAEQTAAARKYHWGFIEDTPSSLRKDITEARLKADKALAADAMKKAKTLYGQKATSNAARMQDLDQAIMLAYRAKSLNQSPGFWEDKPDTLIAEIKEAQEKLRKKAGIAPASVATKPTTPMPTTSHNIPAPVLPTTPVFAPNSSKTDVLRVVAEGRQLLAQDRVLEAKAKADSAHRMMVEKGLHAAFTAGDDTPDQLLAACKAKGTEMVKSLMIEADKQIALVAYDRADAACTTALQLTNAFGLYARAIEEKRTAIAPHLKPVAPTVVATAPIAPLMLPPRSTTPVVAAKPPVESLALPTAPVMTQPMAVMAPQSNVLVEQAKIELQRGDLDMARNMATKAYNSDPKAKADAEAILRQCDTAMAARKRSEAATALNNALAVHARGEFGNCQAVLMRIDPAYLTPVQKSQRDVAMADCNTKLNPIKQASGSDDDLKAGLNKLGQEVKAATPPPATTTQPLSVPPVGRIVNEHKAVSDVLFEKLRSEEFRSLEIRRHRLGKG